VAIANEVTDVHTLLKGVGGGKCEKMPGTDQTSASALKNQTVIKNVRM
jgi:hypothetical protein